MPKLDEIIQKFVVSEGKFQEPSLRSYIQALEESLSKMEGRSMTEIRRIEIAKEQVKGVRRQVRRVEEHNAILESSNRELNEKLSILEEKKDKVEE